MATEGKKCYISFARSEEKPALRSRVILSRVMLKQSIYDWEATMPIIETLGPVARSPLPTPQPRRALSRFPILPMPKLEWNAEVERDTAHLYERVKNVIPSVEWPFFAPYVREINRLKKERNAVILA